MNTNHSFQNSKLIDLLQSLDKNQFNRLGSFIKFKTTKDHIYQLYNYLKNHLRKKSTTKNKQALSKEFIVQKLNFSLSELHRNSVNLSLLVQDFLIQETLNESQNKINKGFILLDVYKNNQLDKYFFKQIEALHKLLDDSTIRDANYYYLKSQLYKELFYHPNVSTLFKNKRNDIYTVFQKMESYLNLFYLLSKGQLYCSGTLWERIVNISYKSVFNEILALLEKDHQNFNIPLLDIYNNAVHLFKNLDKNANYTEYEALKQQIKTYQHLVTPLERFQLIGLLINYSGLRVNINHQRFVKETWLLYRYGLENDMLMPFGFLSEQHFNNIISLGIELGGHPLFWLKNTFIPKYTNRIESQKTSNVIRLAKASIAFKESEESTGEAKKKYLNIVLDELSDSIKIK